MKGFMEEYYSGMKRDNNVEIKMPKVVDETDEYAQKGLPTSYNKKPDKSNFGSFWKDKPISKPIALDASA